MKLFKPTCTLSMKIVFVASIIRNRLCIIYGFFIIFSKITFCWKLFSDCSDKFNYPGSIVYLSCIATNIFLVWTTHQILSKKQFWIISYTISKFTSILAIFWQKVADVIKNWSEIFFLIFSGTSYDFLVVV